MTIDQIKVSHISNQ